MFPDPTFVDTLLRYALDENAKLRPNLRFLWHKLSPRNVVFVLVHDEAIVVFEASKKTATQPYIFKLLNFSKSFTIV